MADNAMDINAKPEKDISVRDVFGIDTDMVCLLYTSDAADE